jgi:hypothetical protein
LGLLDLGVFTGVLAVGNGFSGLVVWAGCEPAGVDGQEQDAEVGVELVGEDRVEVEFDEGLPGEAGGVAQQSQLMAVGHNRPQRVVFPVEVVLHHGLRRPGSHPRGLGVQVDSGTRQVQRHPGRGVRGVGPGDAVRDRKMRWLGLAEAGRHGQAAADDIGPAPTQLVQQR